MIYFNLDTFISILVLILSLFIFLRINFKKNLIRFLLGYVDFFLIFFSRGDEKKKITNIKKELSLILINFSIFFLKLIITLSPILVTIFFEIQTGKINTIDIFLSFYFIFVSGAIFLIFIKFKQKKNFNRYDETNKIIHKLIVNNFPLLKLTFDIEKKIFLKKLKSNKKVFITGYARSGTTFLLNELYKSNIFSSLTYKNLPLILSPKINNLFIKIFANQNKNDFFFRAHSDGLKISLNSPEAFEEVFWKFISGNSYVKENYLDKHNLSDEDIKEFNKYVNLVTADNKIYISKNNNNILRLKDLSHLENSKFLIMYREPLGHAYSLFNQHKNFINIQKKQLFIKEYMSSIGHYEFGEDHKPFFNSNNDYNINSINYWIKEWTKFYDEILKIKQNDKFYLISYDKCCNEYDFINMKLEKILNHKFNINFTPKIKNATKQNQLDIDKDVLEKAREIHQQLLKQD